MELKLTQSSLPTNVFNSSSILSKHFHFTCSGTLLSSPYSISFSGFFIKWKLQIQRIYWKGGQISKKILVHVVKEGETLTSISKLYRVPILEIADANKEIVDVNLVFQGQHLNVPYAVSLCTQLCLTKGGESNENRLPKPSLSLRFHSRQWNQIFTMPSSNHLKVAKTSGSFLVLVPLIAFCIRCIIQSRIASKLRHQAANKSGSKSMRWKTVLSDSKDPDDTLGAESEPHSDHFSEDQEHLHAYTKLEDDYQKFLSECGMSNWGYWRGGSPK
ncbi:hypothetical protein ACJIZ3_003088 [Penstemon smallii]|uniref:LysM domain-containing protein n=1 Tax=Penstemon smallii TaxID=265156 RepID=A0ABD3U9N4_9LAMI